MKIILVLIIIILIVAAAYYYSTTTKNWFNAKGEYPEFPFKFEVFNKHGFQVLNQDPEEINSAGLLIQLNHPSPSITDSGLPSIRIRKNVGNASDVTNHETVKDIILDSQKFKISDLGSGLFVYMIAIPFNSDYFSITISGSNKERIDEIVAEIEKSFRFNHSISVDKLSVYVKSGHRDFSGNYFTSEIINSYGRLSGKELEIEFNKDTIIYIHNSYPDSTISQSEESFAEWITKHKSLIGNVGRLKVSGTYINGKLTASKIYQYNQGD